MHSFSEYLEMGGYAAYVWSAYGITAAVMIGLLVASWREFSGRQKALAALETPRRRARPEPAE